MTRDWRDNLKAAAELWQEAEYPIALTGAGISVPSGIPDFHSPGGVWSRFDPMEVASIQSLRYKPDKVWAFLLDMMAMLDKSKPNAAHKALARLEDAGRLMAVITQNIDGLHLEAGSKRVVEFHGNSRRYYCMNCRKEYPFGRAMELAPEELPWRCEQCDSVVRPDIVFYGEHIPPGVLAQSMGLADEADLAVIVGTSGIVAPANTLPVHIKNKGGKVLLVNLSDTGYGDLPDVTLTAPCEEALPELASLILGN